MKTEIKKRLPEFRDKLTRRREELQAEVQVTEDRQRAGAAAINAPSEVVDPEEEASQRQRSEVRQAEQQRDLDELAQVEHALRRIDGGTYGQCSACGEPIPLQRLQVQPAAARCAPCQEAAERAPQR